MSETIGWFDCFSGASGDMILGAMLDCGLPISALAEDLHSLLGEAITPSVEKVTRCGIAASKLNFTFNEERHLHRNLDHIKAVITNSKLSDRVKKNSIAVFTRLGEVEAAAHGVPLDKVHFHEVGALDSIADIVGAVAGFERMGIEKILFSKLRLGSGAVRTEHGILPVPAPATARLVAGYECEIGPGNHELLTPTAAAILTTLGKQSDPASIRIHKIGYGAGSRDAEHHPNVLRLIIGTAAPDGAYDTAWVFEANLDDTTPEICGYAIERLLAAGALDAYVVPIQMKKSRPGLLLCAIAPENSSAKVEEILFRETTTFGIRKYRVERSKLQRENKTVQTPFGPVSVKVGTRSDGGVVASPEYEDCRRIAIEKNIPLREVMEAARKAFSEGSRD